MSYVCAYESLDNDNVGFLPIHSTLYWTERDGRDYSYARGLKFLHLSNVSNISSISLGNRKIRLLTFGSYSRSLYWIAQYENRTEAIEQYNITSKTIRPVAYNAEGVRGMCLCCDVL